MRWIPLALTLVAAFGSGASASSRPHNTGPGASPYGMHLDAGLSEEMRRTIVGDLAAILAGSDDVAVEAGRNYASALGIADGVRAAEYMAWRMRVVLPSAACSNVVVGTSTSWQDGRLEFQEVKDSEFEDVRAICPSSSTDLPFVSTADVIPPLLERAYGGTGFGASTGSLGLSDNYQRHQVIAIRLGETVVEFDKDNRQPVLVSPSLLSMGRGERLAAYAAALAGPLQEDENLPDVFLDEIGKWLAAYDGSPSFADNTWTCGSRMQCPGAALRTADEGISNGLPQADPDTIVDDDPAALAVGFDFSPTMTAADRKLLFDDIQWLWSRDTVLDPTLSRIMGLKDEQGSSRNATARDAARFILSTIRLVGSTSECDDKARGNLVQFKGRTSFEPFRTDISTYYSCQDPNNSLMIAAQTDNAFGGGAGPTEYGYAGYQIGNRVVAVRGSGEAVRIALDNLGRSTSPYGRIRRLGLLMHEAMHRFSHHGACSPPNLAVSNVKLTIDTASIWKHISRLGEEDCDGPTSFVYTAQGALIASLAMDCRECSAYSKFGLFSSAAAAMGHHQIPLSKDSPLVARIEALDEWVGLRRVSSGVFAFSPPGAFYRAIAAVSALRRDACGDGCTGVDPTRVETLALGAARTVDERTSEWMIQEEISNQLEGVSEGDVEAYLHGMSASLATGEPARLRFAMPCSEIDGCDPEIEKIDRDIRNILRDLAEGCDFATILSSEGNGACGTLRQGSPGAAFLEARAAEKANDLEVASAAYADLASKGHAPAAWMLARMLIEGKTTAGGSDAADDLLLQAAKEIPGAALEYVGRHLPGTEDRSPVAGQAVSALLLRAAGMDDGRFFVDASIMLDRATDVPPLARKTMDAAITYLGEEPAFQDISSRWDELPEETRKSIQTSASVLGLYDGRLDKSGIDGAYGNGTRRALEALCGCDLDEGPDIRSISTAVETRPSVRVEAAPKVSKQRKVKKAKEPIRQRNRQCAIFDGKEYCR